VVLVERDSVPEGALYLDLADERHLERQHLLLVHCRYELLRLVRVGRVDRHCDLGALRHLPLTLAYEIQYAEKALQVVDVSPSLQDGGHLALALDAHVLLEQGDSVELDGGREFLDLVVQVQLNPDSEVLDGLVGVDHEVLSAEFVDLGVLHFAHLHDTRCADVVAQQDLRSSLGKSFGFSTRLVYVQN